VFPALAVAEELRRRHPDAALCFVGSKDGPEGAMAAHRGIPFKGLPARGFLGKGFRSLGAILPMGKAMVQAMGIVREFSPSVAAGFGGYAAFAAMGAAWACRVPLVLHEQNAVMGTANRFMARVCRRVCVSLPGTDGVSAAKRVVTGNPVREGIVRVGAAPRNFGTRRLLVMGGSQGARFLNGRLPGMLKRFAKEGVEIRHQAGRREEEATRRAYVEAGWDGDAVCGFIEDVAEAYAWADLALCRAGASTVAELCAAGLPAVLVPFPFAIHDHQTLNARVLEASGAARLLPQNACGEEVLGDLVLELLGDPERRREMSEAALGLARPDAASLVADALEMSEKNR
jgi:UDP-N-acetylglucosamine--N-acetylmuramyl-(pentapeptide) pyrophosphoryl-undecaprenol N-acetylglucosamine transferase